MPLELAHLDFGVTIPFSFGHYHTKDELGTILDIETCQRFISDERKAWKILEIIKEMDAITNALHIFMRGGAHISYHDDLTELNQDKDLMMKMAKHLIKLMNLYNKELGHKTNLKLDRKLRQKLLIEQDPTLFEMDKNAKAGYKLTHLSFYDPKRIEDYKKEGYTISKELK